jgi:hypothetical protein
VAEHVGTTFHGRLIGGAGEPAGAEGGATRGRDRVERIVGERVAEVVGGRGPLQPSVAVRAVGPSCAVQEVVLVPGVGQGPVVPVAPLTAGP